MDDMPERVPLDAGPPIDAGHISVHAVLVRGEEANFDRSVRGPSDVETGMDAVNESGEVPSAQRWWLAWVAVTHESDGSRAYHGIGVADILVDPIARKSFRDRNRHAAMLDAALRGEVELAGLAEQERVALRRALVHQDPEAWDDAAEPVRRVLDAADERREETS